MSEHYSRQQINDIESVFHAIDRQHGIEHEQARVQQNPLSGIMEEPVEREDDQKKMSLERRELLRGSLNNASFKHHPEASVLTKEYSSSFKPRLSDAKRLQKQRNKRSRLYQKKVNADLLNNAEKQMQDDAMKSLTEAMTQDRILCEKDELCDVAAFMGKDKTKNAQLIKLFLGSDETLTGQDMTAALDEMVKPLLSFNLGNIRLENDKELAKNAGELESLSWKMAAFDRLSSKYGYLEKLDTDMQKYVGDKLERIRSVVNYYALRKDIINDPLYMKHYNDELSMDFTKAKTNEERELAEKLLKAYVAGKDMMEKNGYSQKKLKAIGEPKFAKKEEGARFIKLQEFSLKNGKTKELLQESYKGSRMAGRVDELYLKDSKVAKKLSEEAFKNIEGFKGDIEKQPGYKEPEYDASKIKDFIKELDEIKITSLKGKSYKELVENFNYNYELCNRVRILQHQIVRGLSYGWEDPAFDDAAMMEMRAKTRFFDSFRKTLCIVNNELAFNKEASGRSNAQWEQKIRSKLGFNKSKGAFFNVFLPGNEQAVYDSYKQNAEEEDATKDESIKITYKFLLSKNMEQIPEAELIKRRKDYNKNALIQDYLSRDELHFGVTPSSGYTSYLNEKTGKEVDAARTFGALTRGKSSAEIKRLHELMVGSPEQQLQYETEIINMILDYDLKQFSAKNMGEIVDNFTEKSMIASLATDGLRDALRHVKELIEQSKGKLKVPDRFKDVEDMMTKGLDFYTFAQDVLGGRTVTLSQSHSNKYLHGISPYELGNITTEELQVIYERFDELHDRQNDGEMTDEESDAYDLLCRMPQNISLISGQDTTRPQTVVEQGNNMAPRVITFKADPVETYKKASEYLEKHRQWEKTQQQSKAYNKDFNEATQKYDRKSLGISDEEYQKLEKERDILNLVNSMSFLENVDGYDDGLELRVDLSEEEMKKNARARYMALATKYDPKTEFDGFKKKVEEMNNVFNMITSVDIDKFYFTSFKDLTAPSMLKLRVVADMAMEGENLLKRYKNLYKNLQDSFKDENDEEREKKLSIFKYNDFDGLKNRMKFLQIVNDLYSKVPELMEDPISKDFDLDDLVFNHTSIELSNMQSLPDMCNKYGEMKWMKFISNAAKARATYSGTREEELKTGKYFGPEVRPSEYIARYGGKFHTDNFVQKWTGDPTQKGLSIPKW